jgi:hypothetical protein
MTTDTEPIPVVFRTFKQGGDVIALFPTLDADANGHVTSYQHVGQHGAADYAYCMRATRPATGEESAALARELEGPPYRYNLQPMKRRPSR